MVDIYFLFGKKDENKKWKKKQVSKYENKREQINTKEKKKQGEMNKKGSQSKLL